MKYTFLFNDISQSGRVGFRTHPARNGVVRSVLLVLRNRHAGSEHVALPVIGATQPLNHRLNVPSSLEMSPMNRLAQANPPESLTG